MGEETSVYKGNIGVSQKGKVMKLLYYTWDEYAVMISGSVLSSLDMSTGFAVMK